MIATLFRALQLALLLVSATTLFGGQAEAAKAKCPDGGNFPKACTKEIRVWNNTPRKIFVVLQGSIQKTDALNCTVAAKGGGDVWLQAAFGDRSKCYTVKSDYYVYVNPKAGIPPNSFVSVNLPWWSKRKPGADDVYIDWWRAGRIYIFDDQVALNDSYGKLKDGPQVEFAANSPLVTCKNVANNECRKAQLQIFQVTPEATIAAYTPFQLNEYTFADVSEVINNGQAGGEFIDFNQNYNVSNVDQVYLPIAMQPVREPPDIGYMGSTMSVGAFRKQLEAFTGADLNPRNPRKWPIYNNPIVSGQPIYPRAGVRVPSALAVFNFYMNPSVFPTGQPEIIPANPPQLISNIMSKWTDCTTTGTGCPQSAIYKEIDAVFAASYAEYISKCTPPDFLKPEQGTNPPAPKLVAYLRFIHGWVPFNTSCTVPINDLPTADMPPAGSRAPVDYISVQYNFQIPTLNQKQWFNPYTLLIHGSTAQGGLGANAYAFSIDDHSSFLSNDGGSLPGGLIFAVGGDNGLPNKTQVPPPVPTFYKYFSFSVGLGAPAVGAPSWLKYGVCKENADTLFPGTATSGYVMGVDPALEKITASNPCTITLVDSNNRKYKVRILKAKTPPDPIWPPFQPSGGNNFDPSVVSCPVGGGVVPPEQWCVFTNELAQPATSPNAPIYSISTRVPLN